MCLKGEQALIEAWAAHSGGGQEFARQTLLPYLSVVRMFAKIMKCLSRTSLYKIDH
jgi:hypothetical protein